MSNILVIGNGFDLAHRLPTRYTDFLDFANYITYAMHRKLPWDVEGLDKLYKLSSAYGTGDPCLSTRVVEQYNDFFYGKNDAKSEAFWSQFCDNILLNYFRRHRLDNKWIDFENELESCIKLIGEYLEADENNLNAVSDPIYFRLYDLMIGKEAFDSEINKDYCFLLSPLCELIKLLDFYLGQHVSKMRPSYYPSFLYEQEFTHVLSFNYTDTYRLMQKELQLPILDDEHIQFIHGHITTDTEAQNMVLGISSADPENLKTLAFKKYFQRIQKKTGINYSDWCTSRNQEPRIVTIMGHSLDPTDGDIIRTLVESANLVCIYYHSEAAYEQQIVNMIRIFTSPVFLARYYRGQITFRKQPESIPFDPKN